MPNGVVAAEKVISNRPRCGTLPKGGERIAQFERKFDKGGISVDESLYPVIVTTWYGETTRALVDAYFEWFDDFIARALVRGVPVIFISDVLEAERPDPIIRRYVADESEKRRTDERDALMAGNVAAVRNAAVRGALTAIGWLSSRPDALKPVKDLATAFEKARAVLVERGIAIPPGLDERATRGS